jgi:colanic acid/amylovoran biosynthesis glycosyltransferase
VRIAYVVSRFPDPSETFVLRELNAVDRRPGVEVELFVLFPPKDPFVHPEAQGWLGRAHRASPAAAVAGVLWWLGRRPLRTSGALASVLAGHWRKPGRLLRALIACAAAAAHARTMRRLDVDHIHAHFATYPALAAWLAGRLLDVPYSFTAHAHDIYVDQLHLATLSRGAKAIAAISEFNRSFLAPYVGDAQTPVDLVRCGVIPSAYAFRPRSLPVEGPVRAICVATLNELKGHAILLDALAGGGPELERLELDLVGSGPLEAPLREQVKRLGLERRVRFHGTRSEDEVADMLDRADLFVLASVVAGNGRMDGIPVALMEALATGLPVVASRLSGIPELVRDGETGLLAQPGDAADLARALRRVLSDPEAAMTRALAGRRLIEQEFDIERSADCMLALFGVEPAPSGDRAGTPAPRAGS